MLNDDVTEQTPRRIEKDFVLSRSTYEKAYVNIIPITFGGLGWRFLQENASGVQRLRCGAFQHIIIGPINDFLFYLP